MLIDAHAHLDLSDDLDAALAEITQHQIFTVSVSIDLPSYKATLEIARRCDLVLPTFGVHPGNAPQYASRLDELAAPIAQSPMLGEIGLDYALIKDESQYPAQRTVCEYFFAAAQAQGKIVNLHAPGAERDILRLLQRYDLQRAIIHWYSGPLDMLDELIALGVMFTVGVEVMTSNHIRAIARRIPENQLLTETDNPVWEHLSDNKASPALLKDVIHTLAEVRGKPDEEIVQIVHTNFVRLIRDDPHLADVVAKLVGG